MQTRNPILDEFAKLTTGAMGLAQAAGEEAKTAWRAQADRIAAEMHLVRRDEFDVLKDEIAALQPRSRSLRRPRNLLANRRQSPPASLLRERPQMELNPGTQPVEPNLRTGLPFC